MTEIPIGSRVALRNGVDDVYLYALVGSEGWVREAKVDDDGFELVYVQWDEDHWRFNNQPNGWTFASHFDIKELPKEEIPEEPKEVIEPVSVNEMEVDLPAFLAQLTAPKDGEEDPMDEYMEELTDAMDAASASEGFLMLTIKRIPNPENPNEVMFVPSVFSHTLSEEAHVLLDIQLAECASISYQEMMQNLMQVLAKKRTDDS